VIRVSQWAEIRQMFYADAVPGKEIARRFGLDVKTVRRAISLIGCPCFHRSQRSRFCESESPRWPLCAICNISLF